MALLNVLYTAPLPDGFVSGSVTLKRDEVYIDAMGNKALAQQVARINPDKSLTDVATGQALTTVASGPGDPLGGLLTWVETLIISGLPDPVRSSYRMTSIYTAPGQLDLHRPNDNARTVGTPADAAGVAQQAAREAQQTAAAAALLQGMTFWEGGDHTTTPAAAGLYRLTSGSEAGQIWERKGDGSLTRNAALEAANAAEVDRAALLATLATKYISSTTATPTTPSQAERDAYAAAHPERPWMPGSRRTADGGVQALRDSAAGWQPEGAAGATGAQVTAVRTDTQRQLQATRATLNDIPTASVIALIEGQPFIRDDSVVADGGLRHKGSDGRGWRFINPPFVTPRMFEAAGDALLGDRPTAGSDRNPNAHNDYAPIMRAADASRRDNLPLHLDNFYYSGQALVLPYVPNIVGIGKDLCGIVHPDGRGLVVGPGTDAGGKGGVLRDFAVIGQTVHGMGTSAITLDGLFYGMVENISVRNNTIGFDLRNNCFGSTFRGCDAQSDFLKVGANMRTGPQSGNDIFFYNCWLGGGQAAVSISPGSGGFVFFGGQMAAGVLQTGPNDIWGVVTFGRDYGTGQTGGIGRVALHGVDIEGYQSVWALRGYGQVSLTVDTCALIPYGPYFNPGFKPALGVLKMDGAADSQISFRTLSGEGNAPADGYAVLEVNGAFDAFSAEEVGTLVKLGDRTYTSFFNAGGRVTRDRSAKGTGRVVGGIMSAAGPQDHVKVYGTLNQTTNVRVDCPACRWTCYDNRFGGMAEGVFDPRKGAVTTGGNLEGVTIGRSGTNMTVSVAAPAPDDLYLRFTFVDLA